MTNKILIIDGPLYKSMLKAGARKLKINEEKINALNVFPVPDGDTGTNMNMSFSSGIKELDNASSDNLQDISKSIARGLLMGARGNSGVILSQLFRGFSKSIEGKESINALEFAEALKAGKDLAYKAIMKPVEGTILTVSKDAANKAVEKAKSTADIVELMEHVVQEARDSLKRTKEILPLLKQVGVVDSGGQGLVNVYEGMLSVLTGADDSLLDQPQDNSLLLTQDKATHVEDEVAEMMSQGLLSVDDIQYGYCTEFMILRNHKTSKPYNEHLFREQLSHFGDSLLVISDDELVKVHIHAEKLNEVLFLAQQYGELGKIKIENMREQFRTRSNSVQPTEQKEHGVVAIGVGEGIRDLFLSVGVDYFVLGGQTMNPSTEDIVKTIEKIHAKNIYVLPNNSNIIMTAQQAAELVERNVFVIPSKTIQQGLSSMMAFNTEADADTNINQMKEALGNVLSGQVTFAVRDTEIDGVTIKKDDFMGIADGKILLTETDLVKATALLTGKLIQQADGEIVTLIYGEDVKKEEAEKTKEIIEGFDVEVELHFGGQPLYPYLISVE